MKWLADVFAFLAAAVSFCAVAIGTNPPALAFFVGLFLLSGAYLCRRVQHGLDQVDFFMTRQR